MPLALSDPNLLCNRLYINGRWIHPKHCEALEVRNPATGSIVTSVPNGQRSDAQAGIQAAVNALPEWSARPAKDRSMFLRQWHDLVVANVDDLAQILTAEQGKPINEARGEILFGAAFFEWFAEEAKRIYGET
ncbi:uncharacterized protein METZ01_LOCUS244610, partial [marine metagenome]